MSIKYDCYFCETERDMGASWEVCSFNQKEDKDYWTKSPPCEYLDNDCPFYVSKTRAHDMVREEVRKVKITVYTLEDFRPDYEHGVIGVYGSFEKAKEELIRVLKESIMSYEDELDAGEDDDDDEYAEELRGYIAELKESIKDVEEVMPTSYYACNQLYITEHPID